MILRFEVNQAEAFRRGFNIAESVISIEVEPSHLSREQRDLIADRLHASDVCRLYLARDIYENPVGVFTPIPNYSKRFVRTPQNTRVPILIEADTPTVEGLLDGVRINDQALRIEEAQWLSTEAAKVKSTESVSHLLRRMAALGRKLFCVR